MNTGRTQFKKGHIPWNRGIPRKISVKRKISESRKGMKFTKEHKESICRANEGKKKSSRTKEHCEKIRQTILKQYTNGRITYNRGKKFPQLSGKNSPRFGKIRIPIWGKYKDINMRSSWEIAFAKWLDLSGYKWEYESKTFDLIKTTYTPDFYLQRFDLYVEIKGWASKVFKKKLRLFKKLFPDINYKILYQKDLIKLGIIS